MSRTLEFVNARLSFIHQQNNPNPSVGTYELFSGNSKSRGIDFLVSYLGKNYTSWIAYTLSKIENQFTELFRNEAYPNQNDRRHQIKWIS